MWGPGEQAKTGVPDKAPWELRSEGKRFTDEGEQSCQACRCPLWGARRIPGVGAPGRRRFCVGAVLEPLPLRGRSCQRQLMGHQMFCVVPRPMAWSPQLSF